MWALKYMVIVWNYAKFSVVILHNQLILVRETEPWNAGHKMGINPGGDASV